MRSVLFLSLLLSTGAIAQTNVAQTEVAKLLATSPEQIRASSLPDHYRAITLGDPSSSPLMMWGVSGGVKDDVQRLLFAAMGSVFVEPTEFAELLEGKRTRIKAWSYDFVRTMTDASPGQDEPDPHYVTVYLEASGVGVWTPRPDLTRAVFAKAFPNPTDLPRLARLEKTLKAVNEAVDRFAAANGGRPPASVADLRPLLPGVDLNGLRRTSAVLPDEFALLRQIGVPLYAEAKPGPEGRRGVLYSDGRIAFVTESTWERSTRYQFERPRPADKPSAAPRVRRGRG